MKISDGVVDDVTPVSPTLNLLIALESYIIFHLINTKLFPEQILCSDTFLYTKKAAEKALGMSGDISRLTECFLSTPKALGLIPSTA